MQGDPDETLRELLLENMVSTSFRWWTASGLTQVENKSCATGAENEATVQMLNRCSTIERLLQPVK